MSTTVFISGATGYIGQATALAFRRAGYRVIGLVRNEAKAKYLKANEINVVVGDINQLDLVTSHILQASIIIDGVGQDGTFKLFEKVLELFKGKSIKPLYIGTGGLLTHGDNPYVVDETHKPKNLRPRQVLQEQILAEKQIRTAIIRPGFVYGGSGGHWADEGFGIKEDADLVLYGRKDKRISSVHVEDVAEAYVKLAKAGSIIDGEVFDICGPWCPTDEEWRVAAAKAAGWKGKIVHISEIPKDNIILNILEANVIASSQKAFNLLRWKENHLGFVAEVDTYYQAWKNNKAP